MKITTLIAIGCLAIPELLHAQTPIYQESHKELEYTYGLVDNNLLDSLTELERVKYNMRFKQSTMKTEIDQNFNEIYEITVDSTLGQASWLKLAKKFAFKDNQITYWDENNLLLKAEPFDEEQRLNAQAEKVKRSQHGYHPGMKAFPILADSIHDYISEEGIEIHRKSPYEFEIKSGDFTQYVNEATLTIVNSWLDENGIKISMTKGYAPLDGGQGYLLDFVKTEKFV